MAYGHRVIHGFHHFHKSRKYPLSSNSLLPTPKDFFVKLEKLLFSLNVIIFYILEKIAWVFDFLPQTYTLYICETDKSVDEP